MREASRELLERYGCGPVCFGGTDEALYERHLLFDDVVAVSEAGPRQRFEALARSVRDVLSQRWIRTEQTYERENPKRVYYLSLEYLLGRSLSNNVANLMLEPHLARLAHEKQLDWLRTVEQEPDAGLGNGGLGRLAACFLDSMAMLELPAMGYGLRYEYGIFRQSLRDGWQEEKPDHWLRRPDPWEVARPDEQVEVELGCSFELRDGRLRLVPGVPSRLLGIPFDRPVVGWGGKTVNTLRLWAAIAREDFDFQRFSRGEFVEALQQTLAAESLTRVLYPDDSTVRGQALRLLQEYFLVACSIADLIRRFRSSGSDWGTLPEKVAVQLNDTHPSLAVPELMRVLLDDAKLGWDDAWDLAKRTLAYTNHTLLPEALERWPLDWLQLLLPRQLEIVLEINRRLLDDVRVRFPGDEERVRRTSLVEEGGARQVRMAHLAVVGSHSINGVAAIHSELLRTTTLRDLAELFPERFNNKTNGVTPRRWLRLANPALSRVISDAIGDAWITDLGELEKLTPLAGDRSFRDAFLSAKREAKARLAGWLSSTAGCTLDPDAVIDCQVKRIHEYKRQLLNALRVVVLYNRVREDPRSDVAARTFVFAGKAAPAYQLAKLIIKLLNNIGGTLDEQLIPATDVSNQISTAGYEASGTSNMKFMMNGALTLGTRDGATIEMAQEAGEPNFFLFGLTARQVVESRSWYDPHWHYEREPETRAALDLIFSDHFSRNEPGVFEPLRRTLLEHGDHYMHLADLGSYLEADSRLMALRADPQAWAGTAIQNVAASGRFSSDRTIREYAREIWNARPCPVA